MTNQTITMTYEQKMGMVTVHSIVKAFLDYGVEFTFTTSSCEDLIQKRFSFIDSLDSDVLSFDEVVITLYKDKESDVEFIYEDCMCCYCDTNKAFDIVLNALID